MWNLPSPVGGGKRKLSRRHCGGVKEWFHRRHHQQHCHSDSLAHHLANCSIVGSSASSLCFSTLITTILVKITYGVDMFSVMLFLYSSNYHLSEPNGWMFPLYEILLGYQYTHNLEPLLLWLTGSPLGKLFHSGILSFLCVFCFYFDYYHFSRENIWCGL